MLACSSRAKPAPPRRLYEASTNSYYVTFSKSWGNSQCYRPQQENWKHGSPILEQWPSTPYWSRSNKAHIFRIIIHILRETYFSSRYEDNDIIFLVKPPNRSNHPNLYLTGSSSSGVPKLNFPILIPYVSNADILG